jgi:hypothetical protein
MMGDNRIGFAMSKRGAISLLILAAVVAFGVVVAPAATSKIGVASAVKNDVHRVTGGSSQPLSTGSDVFLNERIRTGDASGAQFLFLDKTSLSMGPRAELTLDSFVYNPNRGAGRVVLNAVHGAFRFITGSQAPQNYVIRTPIANIGVRGTIGDFIVDDFLTVILVQGKLIITFNGQTYVLDVRGSAYRFGRDGSVHGPYTYDGTILATGGEMNFPLYGWQYQGQNLENGLSQNTNNIDQIDAIFRHGLTPPPDFGLRPR